MHKHCKAPWCAMDLHCTMLQTQLGQQGRHTLPAVPPKHTVLVTTEYTSVDCRLLLLSAAAVSAPFRKEKLEKQCARCTAYSCKTKRLIAAPVTRSSPQLLHACQHIIRWQLLTANLQQKQLRGAQRLACACCCRCLIVTAGGHGAGGNGAQGVAQLLTAGNPQTCAATCAARS